MSKQRAFSLIEVMVAFAILAGLGITLIQSQIASVRLLSRLKSETIYKNEVESKLSEFEITPPDESSDEVSEVYPDDSELAGARWTLKQSDLNILTVPMRKISYTITWKDAEVERIYSDFIVIEKEGDTLSQIIAN